MQEIEPGLVAYYRYDIWPGNRAGLFSQPHSTHRVNVPCSNTLEHLILQKFYLLQVRNMFNQHLCLGQ